MARPLLYRCPNSGYQVQAFLACPDETQLVAEKTGKYHAVQCLACGRQHLLTLASPRLMNDERNDLPRENPISLESAE